MTITYTKLTWQIYPASGKKWKFSRQILQYPLLLESGNLQLEQTKFPVVSLCFGKISKFPVFSLTDFVVAIFPVFPVQWVPCYNKMLVSHDENVHVSLNQVYSVYVIYHELELTFFAFLQELCCCHFLLGLFEEDGTRAEGGDCLFSELESGLRNWYGYGGFRPFCNLWESHVFRLDAENECGHITISS